MRNVKIKSFTISDQAIAILQILKESTGKTQSKHVDKAIIEYGQKIISNSKDNINFPKKAKKIISNSKDNIFQKKKVESATLQKPDDDEITEDDIKAWRAKGLYVS